MHKTNPLFAEVLEYIEAEGSQIDLENEPKRVLSHDAGKFTRS
ncbi:MAG: hypothetical protein RMZ41_021305 [Nostoc sp. DedVER02]|nr:MULTISPECIES: hypothetical protein [unclassified Nostoc]MDZ7986496.1 hypothetical protein [Nostoc sp. DedVER02]MDZ8112456.1 hypothetical protein [Nostoc sp. DedVER01b]